MSQPQNEYMIFVQQQWDSNWIPFFEISQQTALEMAKKLIESEDYSNFYIGKICDFSTNLHSGNSTMTP